MDGCLKKALDEAANEGMTIEKLAEKVRQDDVPGKSASTRAG